MTHITIPASISIDLNAPFSQQGIYNIIRSAYTPVPGYSIVGIDIPLLNIACKEFGVIDPINELKNAAIKVYDLMVRYYIEPVWYALKALYDVLKSLGLGLLNIDIPVFNLKIEDLFDTNLGQRVKEAVLDLYYNAKQQLIDLLDLLGITWPPFARFSSAELEIEYIVDSIRHSLWGYLIRAIKQIWGLIATGLKLWEAINNQGIPTWSKIWDETLETIIFQVANYLTNIPTIKQIYQAILEYARLVYNKFEVTYQEIMDAMSGFTFPIFGKPFDWDLPWNPNVNFPELDFSKMMTSILVWMKNFLFNIINQFNNAVVAVFQFFGISFAGLAVITIPVTFCAIPNEPTETNV
jgi:hypothetical protein